MKISFLASVVSVGCCILALTGCTSKPTTADAMRQHSTAIQAEVDLKNQLAKDWEKGNTLITSGEKKVRKGEKRVKSAERDLRRGQNDIDLGKQEITEGQSLVIKSERSFRDYFPGLEIKP